MSCTCNQPRPFVNPNHLRTCVVCGRQIPETWDTENICSLLDHLEEAIPGVKDNEGQIAPEWESFRRQCEAREEAGRETFGYRYLGRENEIDATEEASDLANYLMFAVLRRRRQGRDDDIDVALTGVHHAFKAHQEAHHFRAKGRGAP